MPDKINSGDKNESNLSESEIEKGIKVMELQNLVLKRILREKKKDLPETKSENNNWSDPENPSKTKK